MWLNRIKIQNVVIALIFTEIFLGGKWKVVV